LAELFVRASKLSLRKKAGVVSTRERGVMSLPLHEPVVRLPLAFVEAGPGCPMELVVTPRGLAAILLTVSAATRLEAPPEVGRACPRHGPRRRRCCHNLARRTSGFEMKIDVGI
jgi:hypothetical protein